MVANFTERLLIISLETYRPGARWPSGIELSRLLTLPSKLILSIEWSPWEIFPGAFCTHGFL